MKKELDYFFVKLSKSQFRSRFHLSDELKHYVSLKGMEVIQSHARDFVKNRLAPAVIPNDGKQTPMKGHPVFVAQHATATCCRGCLSKWYHIDRNRALTEEEQEMIVNIIMRFITEECKSVK